MLSAISQMGPAPLALGPVRKLAPPTSRHITEYIRPGTFTTSLKQITKGIWFGGPLTAVQIANAAIYNILGCTTYFAAYLASQVPLSGVTGFQNVALLTAALGCISVLRTRHLSVDCNIFRLQQSVAERAYSIRDGSGGEIRIAPDDTVIGVHINPMTLRAELQGVPKSSIPARFAALISAGTPDLLARGAALMDQTGAKALRFYTYHNPHLLEPLQDYAVTKTALSDEDAAANGLRNKLVMGWMNLLGDTRLIQIFYNFRFRPVTKWLRTYPSRTFLLLREDVDTLRTQMETTA